MHLLVLAGGTSPHTQRYLRLLLQAGHQVTHLDRACPFTDQPPGFRHVALPGIRGLHRLPCYLRELVEPWARAFQLHRLWRQVRPDVVNVHYLDARAYHCTLARLRPLVLTCWGSDINNHFDTPAPDGRARAWATCALRFADGVTADSRQVLERCELLAAKPLRSTIFYFGIDTGQFADPDVRAVDAFRRSLGIHDRARVLLSVRRLVPKLGQQHVLEAFAQIARDPALADVVLIFRVFLDSEEDLERILQRRAEELGIGHRLVWIREMPYDKLPLLYALSYLVINYPTQDALPVSLLEAAAAGRAIVASDLPVYRECFGDSIVLVPPADSEALAAALRRCLLEGAAERIGRVTAARRVVAEKADQAHTIKSMLTLLEHLRVRPTCRWLVSKETVVSGFRRLRGAISWRWNLVRFRVGKLRRQVARWLAPVPPGALRVALASLGSPAEILVVHASLSACGHMPGGVQTVIDELRRWLGSGTIVMPTHTYCYPNAAGVPPVFNLRTSPSLSGAISEFFRGMPGVVRSVHPTHSLAALGPLARELCAGHEMTRTPCGKATPYERIVTRPSSVLMLGVDLDTYTLFHTAEDAANVPYLYEAAEYCLRWSDEEGVTHPFPMKRQDMGFRRRFAAMDAWLQERGLLRRAALGRGELLFLPRADLAHAALVEALRADPDLLLAPAG